MPDHVHSAGARKSRAEKAGAPPDVIGARVKCTVTTTIAASAHGRGSFPQRDASGLPNVVGFIARRPAGGGERWALYRPGGALSNSFAADLDRDGVAALLTAGGLTLKADNTVISGARRPAYHAEAPATAVAA